MTSKQQTILELISSQPVTTMREIMELDLYGKDMGASDRIKHNVYGLRDKGLIELAGRGKYRRKL